jgi:hypothetical protein
MEKTTAVSQLLPVHGPGSTGKQNPYWRKTLREKKLGSEKISLQNINF